MGYANRKIGTSSRSWQRKTGFSSQTTPSNSAAVIQRLEVHPGIVFLIPNVPRRQQIELFSAALDAIAEFLDVVNTAIDVAYEADRIRVSRYALP